MNLEFSDSDFDSEPEPEPAVTEKEKKTGGYESDDDSVVVPETTNPTNPESREPAVASDVPPGTEKNDKLCIDRKILTNYRTIGFVSNDKQETIFLMVAPEGTYFGQGRYLNTSMCPGKDDRVPPRVFLVLLDDVTLELCQFDVSFTITVESYACTCNVRPSRMCTTMKTKMAFVSEGKPEDAPPCLIYKASYASPPSVRQWYPHDTDTVLTHHQLPRYFRFPFKGSGPSMTTDDDSDDEDVASITGSKTYLDDDDDEADVGKSNMVSSKSQDSFEKLQRRVQNFPYVTAHALMERIDASLFYEQAVGRTHNVTIRKENHVGKPIETKRIQSLLLFPLLSGVFRSHGEVISIPTIKMQTARRVARLLDAAYHCDPRWRRIVKRRKNTVSIDDGEEGNAGQTSASKLVRIPVAFIMAFGMWGDQQDLLTLPKTEIPSLTWPGGVNRPSYQLGFAATKSESEALSRVLSRSPVGPRQIGMAKNFTAVSDCVTKFARRNDLRLPYLYAGRLDSAAASDRRRIVRFCRHYGFSVEVAIGPFFISRVRDRYKGDTARFMRLVDLLMGLSKHSKSTAVHCYDRLSDVDARGGSCDIPEADPHRVALQVANACSITVLPGTDPRVPGVCKTYGAIVPYFKAYVLIRDMRDPEAAASITKSPSQLNLERIKTKRVVFSGHEALMEMFSRHFQWNTENRKEFERTLVRTGVFLDAISYCNLRKFEANPVTIGTKQFTDAFSYIGIQSVPDTFFDPERRATFETATKSCIPPEVITTGVHFEWTGSTRIQEATTPGATVNARFFSLYDRDTWKTLDTIKTKMPQILREFNIQLNTEMLSSDLLRRHIEDHLNLSLATKLASIDEAGNFMVIVPQALGSPHVMYLRSLVRETYGSSDSEDEFDQFFHNAKFIVQSHEIKDSLASSPRMKGCDIILHSSHLLGMREFLDIMTRIVRETSPSRIETPGKRPKTPMTIYLSGFIYGSSPGEKSALTAILKSSLDLQVTVNHEPDPEVMLKTLCQCSVLWAEDTKTASEPNSKRRKIEYDITAPSYFNQNPGNQALDSAISMGNTVIIATSDPYVPGELLQRFNSAYHRVYVDAFVTVSRYGKPTLPYGKGDLFRAKQANEKFWTGASFVRSVNDFPGQDAISYDHRTDIVVSISRVALEYSCANRRQLLWLLCRARVVILTDVEKKPKRFQETQTPSAEPHQILKPYMAATEIKRAFGGETVVLENDRLGSVERYLRDLFNALK